MHIEEILFYDTTSEENSNELIVSYYYCSSLVPQINSEVFLHSIPYKVAKIICDYDSKKIHVYLS